MWLLVRPKREAGGTQSPICSGGKHACTSPDILESIVWGSHTTLHYTFPSTNVTKPSPGTPLCNEKIKVEGQTQCHPCVVPHGFDLNECESGLS